MAVFKPSRDIWDRINYAIVGENTATVLVTLISGMTSILVDAGVCETDEEARAHLAAIILSPDTGPIGALAPQLEEHFRRLRGQLG
jgi:hypothetical protein